MHPSSASTPAKVDTPVAFAVGKTSEGESYLVPAFLRDATALAFKEEAMKRSLGVDKAPGGVGYIFPQCSDFQVRTCPGASTTWLPMHPGTTRLPMHSYPIRRFCFLC